MCQTIIGRVGSSVLLFQTNSSNLPYDHVGAIYSLSNLLCFCMTAPKILADNKKRDKPDDANNLLTKLVAQAKLEQDIDNNDLLLPSIFTKVKDSFFTDIESLVNALEDLASNPGAFNITITKNKDKQYVYLLLNIDFTEQMKTVERYLQL